MKRMLLASAITALFFNAVPAQITVTNSTFPAAGDSLLYAEDEAPLGMNPATAPGGGQIWDFSTLQADNRFSVVYRPASQGAHAADYPGADLVITGQTGETYFNVTNSAFEALGYAGADPQGIGVNVVSKFTPPAVERYSPMQFFDIKNGLTNLTLTFPTNQPPLDSIFGNLPVDIDSMRLRASSNNLNVVDGWGTCQIPGGTYPVLRQKRTTYNTTSIDVYVNLGFFGQWVDLSTLIGGGGGGGGIGDFIGTDTTISYRFYNDVSKEEIAVATMNNDEVTVASMRYKDNGLVPSFEPVLEEQAGTIQAFPNPAVEWVRFDCTNLSAGDYTLKIFNIIGKCVWKRNYSLSGTTSFKVDLDDFKKGTYIYSLVDKNGNAIGTKRLVVLKP